MIAQQLFNGLVLGAVYALFALGFTLTFGVLRVINLLYGFYFAAGAYGALSFVERLGFGLWPATLAGIAAAGLAGILLDMLLLAPLRRAKAPELSSLIVTLGGVLLLNSLMQIVFGAEVRRFPVQLLGHEPFALFGLLASPVQIGILVVVALLVLLLFLFLEKSRIGIAIRAIAEKPDSAALMGVPVDLVMALVSFLSAGLAAAAGILTAMDFNAVEPYMGEQMMLKGFALVVIGGLGDIRGALLTGLGLGLVEVLTAGYVSSDFKDAVAFAALLLALWLRPSGLFARPDGRRA